ncbi:hypothetical protein Ae201684P_005178 [Aphanomyces euteiches]|nr:hypothetical protein Ae201684P_005178 [Aphanomyces euteiches]
MSKLSLHFVLNHTDTQFDSPASTDTVELDSQSSEKTSVAERVFDMGEAHAAWFPTVSVGPRPVDAAGNMGGRSSVQSVDVPTAVKREVSAGHMVEANHATWRIVSRPPCFVACVGLMVEVSDARWKVANVLDMSAMAIAVTVIVCDVS